MTLELFLTFLTGGSAVSSLIVQSLKKTFKYTPSNLLALITSLCVGFIGCLLAYMYMDIPYTLQNVVSALLLGVAMWVGSMCGYDKVVQLLRQFGE